jgi:hypothetical protein
MPSINQSSVNDPQSKPWTGTVKGLVLTLVSVAVMLGTQYYFTHNGRKEFWGPELVEAWSVYFPLLILSVFIRNNWLKALCLLAGNIWVALVGEFVRVVY